MVRRGLSIAFSLILALGALLVVGAWVEAATPRAAPAAPALTLNVDSLLDAGDDNPGNGICHTATDGKCSLRAAVQELNAQAAGGVISLPSGTYVLTDGVAGDLQLQKNIALSGAGASLSIIQGNPSGWAHRILRVQSGANTLVSGVTISGGHPAAPFLGGGILVVSGTLALSNSVVSNSSAVSGGGIYATTTVTLTNVTVSNNTATNGLGGGMYANADLAATNSVFQNNSIISVSAYGGGGGLFALGAFTGNNVNFLTNTVTSDFGFGGGLLVDGPLALNGGQFVDNRYTGTVFGGGLHANNAASISGTQFIDNAGQWGGGADITDFSFAPHSLLTNVTFISNSASLGSGGGLVTWYTATLTAVNFYSNSAPYGKGGAAYAGVYSNVVSVLQGGTMVSNTALGGGGLYSEGSVILTGTQFLSNTAFNGNGGGAWISQSAAISGTYFAFNTVITGGNSGGLDTRLNLVATNATFFSNRNLNGNGGGSGAGANATLTNVTYTVNSSAQGVGGGLLAFGTASVTNGQFLSNTSASVGGGLYGGNVAIKDSHFENNHANGDWGGGLFAFGSAAVTNTRFISNASLFAGGGLAAHYGDCSVVGGSFERNAAFGGAWGGGVYCGGSALSISGTQFLTNSTDLLGGGISGATTWLTNTTFTNNSTLYGGGVAATGPLHVLNSLIQNNHAQSDAGGVSGSSDVWISNTAFISNTAGGSAYAGGGAVVAFQSITATNSSFSANTASTSDGGALAAGQSLYLDHSTFTGNSAAAGDGGAAFAPAGATLDHVTFSGNRSGLNGGGLAVTGTLVVSSSLVTGNSALNGGGLYQYAGDGRIVNSLFAGNTASSAGWQLYLAPSGTLQILFDTIGAPVLALGDAVRIAGGSVQVYDTIVTNHAIGLNHVGGTLIQDYNLFFGDTQDTAGGSISSGHFLLTDPLFADPAGNDYHLRAGSPAIDSGVDLGVTTDIDDQARPMGAGVDRGYDEFTPFKLLLPLIRR